MSSSKKKSLSVSKNEDSEEELYEKSLSDAIRESLTISNTPGHRKSDDGGTILNPIYIRTANGADEFEVCGLESVHILILKISEFESYDVKSHSFEFSRSLFPNPNPN